MKIHKEGISILLTEIVVVIILYVVAALAICPVSPYCNGIAFLGAATVTFTAFFFRNPVRSVDPDHTQILAPADGEIVAIEEIFEREYLQRRCLKISIFMSIWDIHVNRYPTSGKISYTKYHPGKYFIAKLPKSSDLNEHQTVVIEQQDGTEIMIKQIAGILARRIICYAKPGDRIIQGDEMGFIKFGSRVDLFLPVQTAIHVSLHQKVIGNITNIGSFAHSFKTEKADHCK